MRWNVVELAENGRYAKLFRGFLLVMQHESEIGRVVIDEMSCLLLSAEQATLSKPVMVRLAEQGIPIVLCGKNYHPIAITLPYGIHHQSTRLLQQQINTTTPLKKRLWQQLVKTKIEQQRQTLTNCCPYNQTAAKQLERLATKVRSGDPENREAQASRLYWQALMGEGFRRQHSGGDFINSALNYGYTIMRAACARMTVAAGLNPALGLHHSNQNNPFCLIDDLMEIYRPLVDRTVYGLDSTSDTLAPEHKRALARLLQLSVLSGGKMTTINSSMQFLAFSLISSYEKKEASLQLPVFPE